VTAIPALIGRYRVEAVLGRGAMGVVYRAHDPEIDRKIAIKLVCAELLAGEDRSSYVQRFRREAQAAGRCSHPNIVAIHDLGLHEGNPFLAMEYVPGVSLAAVAGRSARLKPNVAASIILPVLDALDCAHTKGIIHRDIKPANILLSDQGLPVGGQASRLVKVADFGIARVDAARWTAAGDVVGTPCYMSPEQCRGAVVDARTDLFSTGAVLFELLAGVPPFGGHTYPEAVYRLLHEPVPDLASLGCAGAHEMQVFLETALARAPEARFGSAADMAAALRAALGAGAAGMSADQTVSASLPQSATQSATDSSLSIFAASSAGGDSAAMVFDAAMLAPIERQLTEYIGPIAKLLVQSGIRKAGSVDALCDLLATSISQEAERTRFLSDTRQRVQQAAAHRTLLGGQPGAAQRGADSAAMGSVIGPSELEAAARDLARFTGPIAMVLVRRAAKDAASRGEFRERLAMHIADREARERFLR
jgi:serine/threonine-protein kinase